MSVAGHPAEQPARRRHHSQRATTFGRLAPSQHRPAAVVSAADSGARPAFLVEPAGSAPSPRRALELVPAPPPLAAAVGHSGQDAPAPVAAPAAAGWPGGVEPALIAAVIALTVCGEALEYGDLDEAAGCRLAAEEHVRRALRTLRRAS